MAVDGYVVQLKAHGPIVPQIPGQGDREPTCSDNRLSSGHAAPAAISSGLRPQRDRLRHWLISAAPAEHRSSVSLMG